MEKKIYRCLYPICNSIPEIQLNEGHIEFNCEKEHKEIISFEKIDSIIDNLININKEELDICKVHKKKFSFYCKNHKQNICDQCNTEEEHKNCALKFKFEDLEPIDTQKIPELIDFVKKRDTYLSQLLQQIINSYENYKNNYILYLNAHHIIKNISILNTFRDKII